jgi:hypothetical protein
MQGRSSGTVPEPPLLRRRIEVVAASSAPALVLLAAPALRVGLLCS